MGLVNIQQSRSTVISQFPSLSPQTRDPRHGFARKLFLPSHDLDIADYGLPPVGQCLVWQALMANSQKSPQFWRPQPLNHESCLDKQCSQH